MSHKDQIAKKLAAAHFDLEPGITRIFKLEGRPESEASPDAPIKLLEVNAATPPSGIMPLHFGPVPGSGIPYPSVIVEVTPDEYHKIQVQELRLPEGWTIGEEYAREGG